MSAIAKMVMARFYRQAAGNAKRLPWHRDTPSKVLILAVDACKARGRALDVGCGAGVFSVWLADKGMDVTGIDLFPEAIALAEALASRKRVKVEFASVNLFTFASDRPFELVCDSGCLHTLVGGNVASYKRQLLKWLAPGGQYTLVHWGKRHALDWRPVGPRRRSQASIERVFGPELSLVETEVRDFAVRGPLGPTVRRIGYWFRRTP